jgi:hypothetical protein
VKTLLKLDEPPRGGASRRPAAGDGDGDGGGGSGAVEKSA